MKLKLNYPQTILIGFAFLSICAFWQMYDYVIPLILKNTFGLEDGISGIIMALDNVIALFLLPLLGSLSDKASKRLPFIAIGTGIAAALMVLLPIIDNSVTAPDDSSKLILFLVALGMLLLSMASYRSPAVALMADVTPKPLRSKGNAVINLMGAIGAIITLVLINLLIIPASETQTHRESYLILFIAIAIIMILSVIILIVSVNERKLVNEMKLINYGVANDEDDLSASGAVDKNIPLQKPVMRSLVLILSTVALWFMGYNAVSTAFSKYAQEMWGLSNSGAASTFLLVGTAVAIIAYIPIGFLSSRYGRKRIIQLGLCAALIAFILSSIFAKDYEKYSLMLYPIFSLVGFAQAAVTVNTFPMVWEISRLGNIGKYTGLYYTCSMAAQIITPIFSGYLIQWFGYNTLFPYASIMVALAIIPISLTKHGDSRPDLPASHIEHLNVAD